ncbi:MAG TPA: hypothetical protein VK436_11320 [Methanocella sp.]|nr:hypothetical protein [Methanocella sp.]
MRVLMVRVDERVSEWIERNRGHMSPEDYAGRTLSEYMDIDDEKGAALRFARAHEDMSERLEELQQRIRRLDESLKTCSGEHTPRITR